MLSCVLPNNSRHSRQSGNPVTCIRTTLGPRNLAPAKAGGGDDADVGGGAHQYRSRSISIASERISFTSTLNDSGMPASILCSPLTMFSYTLVRPLTSSDLTVSISCRVYAEP